MKYLITGASGLIGKKLVNKLLEQNACINILTTNKNLKSSNKNINKFYWNPELNKIDFFDDFVQSWAIGEPARLMII